MQFWNEHLLPNLDKRLLVVSHKNTLRALLKQVIGLAPEDIKKLQIPNAKPIVLEFDEKNKFREHYVIDGEECASTNDYISKEIH